MNKKVIYFIRHGEDDKSFRGGWSKHGLTEKGIKQSEKLAEYIKQNYQIEKIISSDLNRARETTEIINSKLKIPVEYTEKLREMNNGYLAGMKNEEAEQKYPGVYYNTLEMNQRYPGGESPEEFYNRVIKDFKYIIKSNEKYNNILIVTHAGVINIIYTYINKQEWSNKIKSIKIDTASIYALEIQNNERKFTIENYKLENNQENK